MLWMRWMSIQPSVALKPIAGDSLARPSSHPHCGRNCHWGLCEERLQKRACKETSGEGLWG
jgi:hypothetical protein